jgi:hypothetical protein
MMVVVPPAFSNGTRTDNFIELPRITEVPRDAIVVRSGILPRTEDVAGIGSDIDSRPISYSRRSSSSAFKRAYIRYIHEEEQALANLEEIDFSYADALCEVAKGVDQFYKSNEQRVDPRTSVGDPEFWSRYMDAYYENLRPRVPPARVESYVRYMNDTLDLSGDSWWEVSLLAVACRGRI